MKLGPVTKLKKRNTATSKKKKEKRYDQFGAIQMPDSGCRSMKILFLLIVTFYFTKTENRTKKSKSTALILLF